MTVHHQLINLLCFVIRHTGLIEKAGMIRKVESNRNTNLRTIYNPLSECDSTRSASAGPRSLFFSMKRWHRQRNRDIRISALNPFPTMESPRIQTAMESNSLHNEHLPHAPNRAWRTKQQKARRREALSSEISPVSGRAPDRIRFR